MAINTIDRAPKLHYLVLSLLVGKDNNIHVKALIDTGCAKTAISRTLYDKLSDQTKHTMKSNQNIKIQTCDGTQHNILGTVEIIFEIVGTETKFCIKTLIIPQLADDFLLGLDFLSSPFVEKITQEHVHIHKSINNVVSVRFLTATDNIAHTIPANEIKTLQWNAPPIGNGPIRCTAIQKGLTLASNIRRKGKVLEAEVINFTNSELSVHNTNHVISVKEMKLTPNPELTNETTNDEYMTQEEYQKAFDEIEKTGYIQPSITSYVEKKNAITEFEEIGPPVFVTDQELFDQFQTSHLENSIVKRFNRIVLNNKEAFSSHKWDIGVTNMIEMDIQVKTPELRIQKYIPIPLHTRDKVKDILDQFLKIGIIRHCREPSKYCSNILVIPKKDKDAIRLLFDGRLLNYDTERLPMASISKSEILSQLAGKDHLSSLDLADAFYHIPLTKEAQPLTAFYAHTHALRMCFTRAPQGLKNSPLYLKMLLDKIYNDMTDTVLFYADDLLIATTGTMENHMNVVEEVITRLVKAGLKLRPAKLLLARTSLEFLGMIFERNTLKIPELRLEAFNKLPSPNTPKRLKSAICAFAYYRHFVPRFSEQSRELMELSAKHPKEFKFTPEHERQYRELIASICKNAITYFPDADKPFYVQTDASMYCAGGRLYQKNDSGDEMLIAAVSRTFTKTERNYTIYKKEALALMYTLRAMDFFLKYAPKVILLVDSKALTYIRLAKESSGILLRFSLELSKYEADIIHIPGEQNEISDLLSRQHVDIPGIEADENRKRTISEKDSIKIMDALTIPDSLQLTKSQLFNLLTGPSPLDDTRKVEKRKSNAREGIKKVKNISTILNKRNIKIPRTTRSKSRPGVILPTNMVMTRAKAKGVSFADEKPGAAPSAQMGTRTRSQRGKQTAGGTPDSPPALPTKATVARRPRTRSRDIPNIEDRPPPHVPAPVGNDPKRGLGGSKDLEDPTTEVVVGEGIKTRDEVELEGNEFLQDSYETVRNHSLASELGFFPAQILRRLQDMDILLMEQVQNDTSLFVQNGIYVKTTDDGVKPVLPRSLIKMLVNNHHYTQPGIHKSPARIERDIKQVYYVPKINLREIINEQIQDCHICQIYNIEKPQTSYTNLPRFKSPRLSWSLDIITDIPQSKEGYKYVLMAVDDFSNYIIPIPMKSTTSAEIITAIKKAIITPFGAPHYFRSDEQPGIYNSNEFYLFLESYHINLLATSVASPFSNGRAESHIKIFKHAARKYFYQTKLIDNWEESIHFVSSALNQSVNTYNFSPEEIMFGYRIPRGIELLTTSSNGDDPQIIDEIMNRALAIREKYNKAKTDKEDRNKTYKNIKSKTIKFEKGQLVLHRQMQVSTGMSSKWKPQFTGPYIINDIQKNNRTAICQHIISGKQIKAHFNNLTPYAVETGGIGAPVKLPQEL